MSHLLRELAKTLPHPLLLRAHHRQYIREQDARGAEIAHATQLPSFDAVNLATLKHSDTVFILGSGSSINQITQRQWDVIQQHDTIGFNFWPVHAFVPRIFIFESVTETRQKDLFDSLLHLLNSRAAAYTDTVKVITELKRPERAQLVTELSSAFRTNLYVGNTVPIVARDEVELVRGLRFLEARGYFSPTHHAGRLFKYGGSVTAMMSLALKMDYRRIVLCGIDLGDQNYFYQDPNLYPEYADWEFVPRGNIHLTARSLPWMVPAQKVIYQFKQTILDPLNVEIFVQNSGSTLYPIIPVIPDEFFA